MFIVLIFSFVIILFLIYVYKKGAVAYIDQEKIYIETVSGKKFEYSQKKVKKLTYTPSGKYSYMHIFIENDINIDKFLLAGFFKFSGKSFYSILSEIVKRNGGELPDDKVAK